MSNFSSAFFPTISVMITASFSLIHSIARSLHLSICVPLFFALYALRVFISFSFFRHLAAVSRARMRVSLNTQRTYLIYLDEIALIFTLQTLEKLLCPAIVREWGQSSDSSSSHIRSKRNSGLGPGLERSTR